jgi:hypothetical protein
MCNIIRVTFYHIKITSDTINQTLEICFCFQITIVFCSEIATERERESGQVTACAAFNMIEYYKRDRNEMSFAKQVQCKFPCCHSFTN